MKITEIDDNIIQGPWKGNVIQGPWKKPGKPEEVSLLSVFGGPEMQALDKVGIKFDEKPGAFDSIDKTVNVRQIKELEKVLGRKIQSYKAHDILEFGPKNIRGRKYYIDNPQVDAEFDFLKHNEETFILWFPPNPTISDFYSKRNKYQAIPTNNERFLVNRTGARKYIRMWAKLVD